MLFLVLNNPKYSDKPDKTNLSSILLDKKYQQFKFKRKKNLQLWLIMLNAARNSSSGGAEAGTSIN